MIKVTREREAILKKALDEVFDHIHIYDRFSMRDEETVKWDVNWGCYGAVSPDVAEEFGEQLCKASRVAKSLTNMELIFTYEEDKEFKELRENDAKFSKAHLDMLVSNLSDLISSEKFMSIYTSLNTWAEEQEA